MLKVVSEIRRSARETARSAALTTAGAMFALVGVGFLTVALWMLISLYESPLYAATAVGVLYCAAGFILLAIGRRKTRHEDSGSRRDANAQPTAPREPLVQLAEGFAVGLQAGRNVRSRGA